VTKSHVGTVAGALTLALALAGAAHAGTAYVPLPGVEAVGPVSYRTQITVTNMGDELLNVEALQLAPGEDGSEVERARTRRLAVLPKRTFVFHPESGGRGLLGLSGSPALHYTARLVGTGGAGAINVDLPIITADTMGEADDLLLVQGLEGTRSKTTDLILVNLGDSAATCTASVYRPDGSDGIEPISVSLAPLSHRIFADLFKGLAEGISEGRAEVSCSNDFYAYAQVGDRVSGQLSIVRPASVSDMLGGSHDDLLKLAGSCAAGTASTVCTMTGPFIPKKPYPNTTMALSMSPPAALYKSLKAHVEVTPTGWNPKNVRGAHSTLYIIVNRNKRLLASLFMRGPGGNNVTMRHGDCPGGCAKAKLWKNVAPELNTKYIFDYEYNAAGKLVNMKVTHKGQVIADISDKPYRKVVEIAPGDKVIIGLSNPFCDSREEPCSIGWKYENLRVELFK
jgi:translation initiation factor IF-1